MSPEEFAKNLIFEMACASKLDLRPSKRGNGEWVVKIGSLVDSGKVNNNAATIWPRENGIRVELYENGPHYYDVPPCSIQEIAKIVCEFCERKSSLQP